MNAIDKLTELVGKVANFNGKNQQETEQADALRPGECVQVRVWANWRYEYTLADAVVGTVTASGEVVVYLYHGTTEPQYERFGQQATHHFGAAKRVSLCDVAHRYGTVWVS